MEENKVSILTNRAFSSSSFKNTISFEDFIKFFDIAFLQVVSFKKHAKYINKKVGTKLLYFNFKDLKSKLDHFYCFKRTSRTKNLDFKQNCIKGFLKNFANLRFYKDFKEIFLNFYSFKKYFRETSNYKINLNYIEISSFFKL